MAHYLEDDFLGLNPDRNNRDADPVEYFSEGFAEFISCDDPGGIYDKLSANREIGSYERIRNQIDNNTPFGKLLSEYIDLDKLSSLQTMHPDVSSNTTGYLRFVPYWIGAALVRFIVEKGGITTLREIMREVQIRKRFAFGWESAKSAKPEELEQEEARVRSLLKQAIKKIFRGCRSISGRMEKSSFRLLIN